MKLKFFASIFFIISVLTNSYSFAGCGCSLMKEWKTFDTSKYFDANNPEDAIAFCSPMKYIYAGQILYSSKNIDKKIEKFNKQYIFDKKLKSSGAKFPLTEAAPVIKTSFGFVLLDGHHTAMASDKLKALNMPIVIVKDMSALSEKDFWEKAKAENLVYFADSKGSQIQVKKISINKLSSEGIDFPLRFFVAETACKCIMNMGSNLTIESSKNPIWMKQIDHRSNSSNRNDIPFIEFKIASILENGGMQYSYDKKIDSQLLSKALDIISSEIGVKNLKNYGIDHNIFILKSELNLKKEQTAAYKKLCN